MDSLRDETLSIKVQLLTLFQIAWLASSALASAERPAALPFATREIRVYFLYENSKEPEKSGELLPVKREVYRVNVLESALRELIAGPTAEEEKQGYQPVTYTAGMKLASVKIKRGIAYAYFTRPEIQGSAPDLASLKFEDAVIKTAKQFREVKKVVACVNGQIEFGIGMVENVPRPCPKEVR